MTAMTFTAAPIGNPDSYYAGRADAHDDATTASLPELLVRAATITDLHPDVWYAVGYHARVAELRLEEALYADAETELAHADHRPRKRTTRVLA